MPVSFLCSTLPSNIHFIPKFWLSLFLRTWSKSAKSIIIWLHIIEQLQFSSQPPNSVLGISKCPKAKKQERNSRSPQCFTFLFCFPKALCPSLLFDALEELFLFCCVCVILSSFTVGLGGKICFTSAALSLEGS